jgi:hypothetical protein
MINETWYFCSQEVGFVASRKYLFSAERYGCIKKDQPEMNFQKEKIGKMKNQWDGLPQGKG